MRSWNEVLDLIEKARSDAAYEDAAQYAVLEYLGNRLPLASREASLVHEMLDVLDRGEQE